jgi:transposase-like protein
MATQDFHKILESISTDEKCLELLNSVRCLSNPICPFCGCQKSYRYSNGKLYKCAKCRRQFSSRTGTILDGTKIPLRKWFMTFYLITLNKKGTSSVQLSRQLGVTQKTAWHMLSGIRTLLETTADNGFHSRKGNITREPMLGNIEDAFERILHKMLGSSPPGIDKRSKGSEKKENRRVAPAVIYYRPPSDFDPEID